MSIMQTHYHLPSIRADARGTEGKHRWKMRQLKMEKSCRKMHLRIAKRAQRTEEARREESRRRQSQTTRVVGNLRRPPKTCHSSSESWENGDSEAVIRYAGKIRPFLKFQYLHNIRNYLFLAGFKASSQSANAKYLVRTCCQHAGEQSCCSKY